VLYWTGNPHKLITRTIYWSLLGHAANDPTKQPIIHQRNQLQRQGQDI